jgi:hypothetical protein
MPNKTKETAYFFTNCSTNLFKEFFTIVYQSSLLVSAEVDGEVGLDNY